MEWRVWSVEVWSVSVESVECEVWSGECKVWSVKCGKCGVSQCATPATQNSVHEHIF